MPQPLAEQDLDALLDKLPASQQRGAASSRTSGRPFTPGQPAWLDEHMMRFLNTLAISAIGPRG
ncbi:MAG: hypothetical protein M3Y49_05890 [Actinomycetota bacterium]|nr:hypothetical protein [Actinomycetota bacterium]